MIKWFTPITPKGKAKRILPMIARFFMILCIKYEIFSN